MLRSLKVLADGFVGRSSTLTGTTETVFALAFQSCVELVGGVIGSQLLQSQYTHNGREALFMSCAASICAGWLVNLWTWWLTRTVG